MLELEPQAWSTHLVALGLINVIAVALAAVLFHRSKSQAREMTRMREQCRRIEDSLMALRRAVATAQKAFASSRDAETPIPGEAAA